jgi:hypothetical protein
MSQYELLYVTLRSVNLPPTVSSKIIHIPICIQQDATLHNLFYLDTALHVSGGTTAHHQERKQLYLQHLAFVTPLLLPAAIVEELELISVCCGWRTPPTAHWNQELIHHMHIPVRCHNNIIASFILETINDTEFWYPRPYRYFLTVKWFHLLYSNLLHFVAANFVYSHNRTVRSELHMTLIKRIASGCFNP